MKKKRKKLAPVREMYPEEMKKHLRALVRVLQRHLYLHEWNVALCYCRDKNREKRGVMAHIFVDLTYLEARIHILPEFARQLWNVPKKNRSYYKIAESICHELCHIHTDPLYMPGVKQFKEGSRELAEYKEIRERQTQRMAVCVMTLVPEKSYLP